MSEPLTLMGGVPLGPSQVTTVSPTYAADAVGGGGGALRGTLGRADVRSKFRGTAPLHLPPGPIPVALPARQPHPAHCSHMSEIVLLLCSLTLMWCHPNAPCLTTQAGAVLHSTDRQSPGDRISP